MGLSMLSKRKQIQRNFYTRDDGDFGTHTIDVFYRATTPKDMVKVPYAMKAFGDWMHVTKPESITVYDPNANLSRLSKVISGSFSWGGKPISIMVSNGKTIRPYACHYWVKDREGNSLPESVLWYNKDGTHGISQVAFDWELPDRENIVWAIGGAGMKAGDALKEGFAGMYSDVFRRTSHMLIGFDEFGYVIAVEVANKNRYEMVLHMKKLGIKDYILLDGGHITASNNDGHKRNVYTRQSYIISLG